MGPVDQAQEVPVAGEVVTELIGKAREAAPVLQQEVRGAEGPGRKDESIRGHLDQRQAVGVGGRAPVLVPMDHVVDGVATTGPRLERANLTAVAEVRPQPPGLGQVVVVERVLRSRVTADVALAAQPAGVPGPTVQVVGGLSMDAADRFARSRMVDRVTKGHRQQGEAPVQSQLLGRGLVLAGLRRGAVGRAIEGEALGSQHGLDAVVVRVEL